jgi:actin-related protein 10
MLPGFFPRLHSSLLDTLALSHPPSPPPSPPLDPPTPQALRHAKLSQRLSTLRAAPRFASLVPLTKHITITNDPSRPTPGSPTRPKGSGQAPAFAPALLNWVGGSLAGALKTGGEEIKKESWQEVLRTTRAGDDDEDEVEPRAFVLPDWTSLRVM